jgi:hypothetical protein
LQQVVGVVLVQWVLLVAVATGCRFLSLDRLFIMLVEEAVRLILVQSQEGSVVVDLELARAQLLVQPQERPTLEAAVAVQEDKTVEQHPVRQVALV